MNTLGAVHAYLGGPGDTVVDGPTGLRNARAFTPRWTAGISFALRLARRGRRSLPRSQPLQRVAADRVFSLLAPFETAINIWPYQFPTGLLKRPVATRVHARSFDQLVEDITSPPGSGRPPLGTSQRAALAVAQ